LTNQSINHATLRLPCRTCHAIYDFEVIISQASTLTLQQLEHVSNTTSDERKKR
jgi:hypothetical protein